jgi:hypothetical protein
VDDGVGNLLFAALPRDFVGDSGQVDHNTIRAFDTEQLVLRLAVDGGENPKAVALRRDAKLAENKAFSGFGTGSNGGLRGTG